MTSKFAVELRGYDRTRVDRLLARTDAALVSSDQALRASARQLLRSPDLVVVLRGYARDQVDDAIRDRLRSLGSTTNPETLPRDAVPSPFVVVFRGYDMAQVDDAFGRFEAAMRSDDAFARASARDALRRFEFKVRIRGYAVAQVDGAVREAVQRLS